MALKSQFGYRQVPGSQRTVPIKKEQQVIRLMKTLRAQGLTGAEIKVELETRRILRRGSPWQLPYIYALTNSQEGELPFSFRGTTCACGRDKSPVAKRCGLCHSRGKKRFDPDELLARLRTAGSMAALGRQCGVSRERIRQILRSKLTRREMAKVLKKLKPKVMSKPEMAKQISGMKGRVTVDSKFIGEKVRQLRTRLGLTTITLAKKTRLSQAQISRLENGLQGFRSATMEKFAKALDVPVAYFYVEDQKAFTGQMVADLKKRDLKASNTLCKALGNAAFLRFIEKCAKSFNRSVKNLEKMDEAVKRVV